MQMFFERKKPPYAIKESKISLEKKREFVIKAYTRLAVA